MLLRTHPLAAIGVLFRSLTFLRRAFQTSKVRNVFWYAIYIGSVALPCLTALLIVGVFAFSASRTFVFNNQKISAALGALGMLAPYLAAAAREFVKWLQRKRRKPVQIGEDDMARGVYATMEKLTFPVARRIYAVMGHTHDQDIQCLPDLKGSKVLYLNTGTWIPVWPDDRPDLNGQVLFPFVYFRLSASQEYEHQYLEWRDDRGSPADSYI